MFDPKFPITPFQSNPKDEGLMRLAIAEALRAGQQGEVPIGAVIVLDGQVVAQAHNAPVSTHNPCAHAEIQAITQACARVQNYRLGALATLYVTLQPCLMCLGAILHARIGRVVMGQSQSRFNHDLAQSLQLMAQAEAWHPCRFEEGCLSSECAEPLSEFFVNKRSSRVDSLSALQRLADLPNVNKTTLGILQGLGYASGADFLSPGLEFHAQRLEETALTMRHEGRDPQQVAILLSVCDYLRGAPVRSWRCFL